MLARLDRILSMLLAAVLAYPRLVHVGERAGDVTRNIEKPLTQDEIDSKLRDMVPLPAMPPLR